MEIEYRVIARRNERDFMTVWSPLENAKMKYEVLSKKFDCKIERRISQIQTIESFDMEDAVDMMVHLNGGFL